MKDNRTSVKRSLLVSAIALALTAALLIGSTFAWFTSTATAGVSKVQAGVLKVTLYNKDMQEVSDTDVLKWQKNDGTTTSDLLWEPGGTYKLEPITIKNTGTLSLKYKIVITGIKGSAKLNNVITWTVDDTALDADHPLAVGESKVLNISGYMDKNADDTYQGEKIDGISIKVAATQYTGESDSINNEYDKDAAYPTIVTGEKLEDAFPDTGATFGFGNTTSQPVVIDGKGMATITQWTDAWVNSDTTIKGVTFENGAVFHIQQPGITLTLEDCVFKACDLDKITVAHKVNSGAGMCFDVETQDLENVTINVKNCTSIGENDWNVDRDGIQYNADGTPTGQKKSRGHGIALNAVSGHCNGNPTLNIENCEITGVRGNAIQLYGVTGQITIKDTKVNSWGMNNNAAKDDAAIRGDFNVGGVRTITLNNVYFGMDENGDSAKGKLLFHVNVGSFPHNTDHTQAAGTYFNN